MNYLIFSSHFLHIVLLLFYCEQGIYIIWLIRCCAVVQDVNDDDDDNNNITTATIIIIIIIIIIYKLYKLPFIIFKQIILGCFVNI